MMNETVWPRTITPVEGQHELFTPSPSAAPNAAVRNSDTIVRAGGTYRTPPSYVHAPPGSTARWHEERAALIAERDMWRARCHQIARVVRRIWEEPDVED